MYAYTSEIPFKRFYMFYVHRQYGSVSGTTVQLIITKSSLTYCFMCLLMQVYLHVF